MADLTLYGESSWTSPWVLHAMVALEEKQLPYKLEVLPLPMAQAQREDLQQRAAIGKVPMLAHGTICITESSAISEYLAEQFPAPAHPRLFPADLGERARARQIMSAIRTSFAALREDRPTTSVFGRPVATPLSERGRTDAAELLRIAAAVVTQKASLFAAWCIADVDLSLALMRLVANGDAVPRPLADYALANFQRPSVAKYVANFPTQR
jgi:glutathione S-transferase